MDLYKVKSMNIKKYITLEPKKEQELLIVRCNPNIPEVWIPSKLTGYLNCKFNRHAYNTKLKAARTLVGFMNYIAKQIELGDDEIFFPLKSKGLYRLELIHLAKYIDYISNRSKVENNYDTVKEKENCLLQFYYFINKAGITGKSAKVETKIVPIPNSNRGKRVVISPFEDASKYSIRYPTTQNVSKKLSDMDEEVWEQFVQYAEKYYPSIAFGLVLQIMGGLRQGEVVNLTLDDIDLDKDKNLIVVWVQDRPELFDVRKINLKKSQTKKKRPREQAIYNFNGRLIEIYNNHLKLIAGTANDTARKLRALFIDSHGNAMSGDSYEVAFKNLKFDFIVKVEEKSPSLADKLSKHKWGSHIGRHIFTNYLIKNHGVDGNDGQPDTKLLQYNRGDENEKSAQIYVDKRALHQAATNSINKVSKAAKANADYSK